ncbi:diguanylate cyclase [Paraglaciecola sp. 2405UD69-4]|uniref:sensor domain-containing diguanylate cyclase n=1 Tax=Paraglaciecola sp. 2405UD69-4 TaxID=3391836 RepID=UPI0039C9A627
MSTNKIVTMLSNNLAILAAAICCILIFIGASGLINNHGRNQAQVTNFSYYVDATHQAKIENILKLPPQNWQLSDSGIYSPAFSDNIHWLKFTTKNLEPSKNWLLEIDNPLLNDVNLWFIQKNEIISHSNTGDGHLFKQRPVLHEKFIFPIPESSEPIDVYISAKSTGASRLPIYLWPNDAYLNHETQNTLVMGVFIGLLLTMGLCSLFYFIATKTLSFLIYTGCVVSVVLTITTLHGLTFRYIWYNSPIFQQYAAVIFASCLVCFSTVFCDQLLSVKKYSPWLSKILRAIALIVILGAALSFFIPMPIFISVFLSMTLISGVIVLFTGIWLWKKGSTVAHYYTLSWFVLYLIGLAVGLDSANVVNFSLSPAHFLMLGATLETIFLALILIISYNKQKQAELSRQAQLLDIERQNRSTEQQVLEQQKSATEELEYKVQERTLELEITLRELSEKNQELEKKNTLDALTGIRNRSYFDKKYLAELRRSKREQTYLSIVMVDIDHFKQVNDIHGHLMGDECIKAVATILKAALKRPSDTVCRYGGEEFAMILPNTDLEGALALIEKIRIDISRTDILLNETSVKVTVSAGIGTAKAQVSMDENSILAIADEQLYKAKNAGRNQTLGSYLP